MGALAWGPRLRTPEPAGTRRCPSPDEYGHCPIPAGAAAVTAYVERRRTGRARGGPKALDGVRRCAPGFRPSMVRKGRSFLRSCGWAPPVGRLDVARARRSHGQRPAVRVALRSAPAATGRRTVRTALSVRGARSTSPGVRGPGGDLPEPVGRAPGARGAVAECRSPRAARGRALPVRGPVRRARRSLPCGYLATQLRGDCQCDLHPPPARRPPHRCPGAPGRLAARSGTRDHAADIGATLASGAVTRDDFDHDDTGSTLDEPIGDPAKLLRVGGMVRQLLEELHAQPLDDAGRSRLVEAHASLLAEIEATVPPQMRAELDASRCAGPYGPVGALIGRRRAGDVASSTRQPGDRRTGRRDHW